MRINLNIVERALRARSTVLRIAIHCRSARSAAQQRMKLAIGPASKLASPLAAYPQHR